MNTYLRVTMRDSRLYASSVDQVEPAEPAEGQNPWPMIARGIVEHLEAQPGGLRSLAKGAALFVSLSDVCQHTTPAGRLFLAIPDMPTDLATALARVGVAVSKPDEPQLLHLHVHADSRVVLVGHAPLEDAASDPNHDGGLHHHLPVTSVGRRGDFAILDGITGAMNRGQAHGITMDPTELEDAGLRGPAVPAVVIDEAEAAAVEAAENDPESLEPDPHATEQDEAHADDHPAQNS